MCNNSKIIIIEKTMYSRIISIQLKESNQRSYEVVRKVYMKVISSSCFNGVEPGWSTWSGNYLMRKGLLGISCNSWNF